MSIEKGWGVLRGLYGFKGWYMWRPEGQIISRISLDQKSFPSCSSPRVTGLGARKWWLWRDMIWLADSLPFGCLWKMNTLRVLKKWLAPELAVLEVGSGRDIQIVLPQYRNNVRERGLQALLTWVHAIRYTLRVFCACFQRKKRIKKCNSKMVHRFILIYSTLPASACSVRHFNAHLKFLSLDRGHNAFNL